MSLNNPSVKSCSEKSPTLNPKNDLLLPIFLIPKLVPIKSQLQNII